MWLGSGEDGVMTWYNPSINICNRRGRGPFTGVNIWPKLSLHSPLQDIRGYPLPYLCTVRGVQTARAWNSKLKFASKNSAHLVYISPQHTAHYRHNSGLVPLKIAQLKGKQNPKRLNSWRKKSKRLILKHTRQSLTDVECRGVNISGLIGDPKNCISCKSWQNLYNKWALDKETVSDA